MTVPRLLEVVPREKRRVARKRKKTECSEGKLSLGRRSDHLSPVGLSVGAAQRSAVRGRPPARYLLLASSKAFFLRKSLRRRRVSPPLSVCPPYKSGSIW